ncbi:MAG: hypothetical protein AB7N76_03255, partial [Planctomycetota bacterium]
MKFLRWTAGLVLFGSVVGCSSGPELEKKQPTREEMIWSHTAHQIEGSPFFMSSLHWRGIYDEMLRIGLEPHEARYAIVRAVRYGLPRLEVELLLDKNRTAAELRTVLRKELHRADEAWEGIEATTTYPHKLKETEATKAQREFTRLQYSVERYHQSALHWLPVFKDMLRLGMAPETARALIVRSAHYGPARYEVERLLDASKGDLATFRRSLDDAYEVSRTGLEAFVKRGGHFKGKDKSWEEREQEATVGGPISGKKAPATDAPKAPLDGPAAPLPPGPAGDTPPPPAGDTPPPPAGDTPPPPAGDTPPPPAGDTPPPPAGDT